MRTFQFQFVCSKTKLNALLNFLVWIRKNCFAKKDSNGHFMHFILCQFMILWHYLSPFNCIQRANNNLPLIWTTFMKSWLLRCSTARGSSTRLSLVGPTKVKARKSFLFTEGSNSSLTNTNTKKLNCLTLLPLSVSSSGNKIGYRLQKVFQTEVQTLIQT